jgi:hypothetical protein
MWNDNNNNRRQIRKYWLDSKKKKKRKTIVTVFLIDVLVCITKDRLILLFFLSYTTVKYFCTFTLSSSVNRQEEEMNDCPFNNLTNIENKTQD